MSFIKAPAFISILFSSLAWIIALQGYNLFGFGGLIIGATFGWVGFRVYKNMHQRGFEKRMERIIHNLDKYEKTDEIERLTLADIKTIQLESLLGSYILRLPGIIPGQGGFIIKDKRDYEEIKKLLMGFSPTIKVHAY
jgi:hypothetical protein